ncbi:MAG: hypothetical protein ACX932_03940 [Gammaproteobacteria bacterium]
MSWTVLSYHMSRTQKDIQIKTDFLQWATQFKKSYFYLQNPNSLSWQETIFAQLKNSDIQKSQYTIKENNKNNITLLFSAIPSEKLFTFINNSDNSINISHLFLKKAEKPGVVKGYIIFNPLP